MVAPQVSHQKQLIATNVTDDIAKELGNVLKLHESNVSVCCFVSHKGCDSSDLEEMLPCGDHLEIRSLVCFLLLLRCNLLSQLMSLQNIYHNKQIQETLLTLTAMSKYAV